MDLPVIGRFFGKTTDTLTERSELIILITPRVVRNLDEARSMTEEFKAKLSTVTREIEREQAEREKKNSLLPKPSPLIPPVTPAPPAGTPNSTPSTQMPAQPAPAPSAAPAGPNASTAPKTIIFGPAGSPIAVDAERLPFEPAGPLQQVHEAPGQRNTSDPGAQNDRTVTQPPLLALAVKAGGDSQPPKIPVRSSLPGPKPGPVWMVQVAAFAEKKDAEALAADLRALGYDAFTQEAQVNAKLWHRVRVGKTSKPKDAFELQKALKANNKFEDAFITR
jgi:cell division septation protein DedD